MWYERAIVDNSIAADELRRMVDSSVPYNHHASRSIVQRATAAQHNLTAAHGAYTRERGAARQPSDDAAGLPGRDRQTGL